ncbi:hypothetical protein [Virgibacillus pantothenticus]|uniref:Uncharacterized protein n=1 Tax=Virgibacillus pantothenticus TaxID=1473 RepID=A0A0L0QKX5_VIRPA|nr:hypothetical protein [Virgibacillus pantothenticus]KNE19242.1 hypothetical protein AFK71_11985 [Virgibacillus pantothenticus]MED3735631.1 hypothetical protein [Virgibacillus pantothenticus]QTY15711.1 hypothetical protein KBP50_17840 [Virgibacillus pantothenticus]SIS95853.1 hypothetical protein SAMN05421787_10817 [Virgibacillus pantothenticus]
MKKVLVSGLCASLLVANFAGTSALAATKEHSTQTEVTTSVNKEVSYDQEFINKKLLEISEGFALPLPYKEGDVEVPEGYSVSVVTNPVTNQSFYRINPVVQTYGLKKWAIVNAFSYGGKALSTVLDVVSDSTAKYIKKNSGKIADAIDHAGEMLHGEIYQALLAGGVPNPYARNIAWAIDAFLL